MLRALFVSFVSLAAISGYTEDLPNGAIQVGTTVITLNGQGSPEDEKQLIQSYISEHNTCVATENTKDSTILRCGNADQVILVSLPILDVMIQLFKGGFSQTEAGGKNFAGQFLRTATFERQSITIVEQ